jgi:hypothetical protein
VHCSNADHFCPIDSLNEAECPNKMLSDITTDFVMNTNDLSACSSDG